MESATANLFQNNAFRITGLPVDATTREITKHADKLKLMEELGQGANFHSSVVALRPPPTMDHIRVALQKLQDPEKRLIDEFFWFWPEEFGQRDSDAGIQAVLRGGLDQAVEIWSSREDEPGTGIVAMHNLAVLYHLCAVEWDAHAVCAGADDARRAKTTKYWRASLKRWERLLADDCLWDKVTNRIRQTDDARLSTGFAGRMRASLPWALSKINLELALAYAEAGKPEEARVHIQITRQASHGLYISEKIAATVLTPTKTRLKEHLRIARERVERNPADGASAGRELIEQANRCLALFDLFFDRKSETRNELSDEVASTCNQVQVSYHKATGEDATCLEVLGAALPFATAVELRQQIEKNIQTLAGNLKFKKLDRAYSLLNSIQDDQASPAQKLNRFHLEATVALSLAAASLTKGSEDHSQLSNFAAAVLRGIALDAWNKHQDKDTALAATDLALEYAVSPELRARLLEDDTALVSMQNPQRQRQDSNKTGLGCLVGIGILVVIAIANSCNSDLRTSTPSNGSYTPPSSVSVPAPSPSVSAPAPGPSYASERSEIESERSRIEDLENQVEQLGREIESERLYLDRRSQYAVNQFNNKVDRYNTLARQAKAATAAFNQKVENYNARSGR